jgi:hypothetical protein
MLAHIQAPNERRFVSASKPISSERPAQAIAMGGIAIEIANIACPPMVSTIAIVPRTGQPHSFEARHGCCQAWGIVRPWASKSGLKGRSRCRATSACGAPWRLRVRLGALWVPSVLSGLPWVPVPSAARAWGGSQGRWVPSLKNCYKLYRSEP